MVNWKGLIKEALIENGENWDDVVDLTLTKEELEVKFYSGYGGAEGIAFTLWTKDRVYFPAVYDGAEWVESVSRNPDGKRTDHIGGQ